jgi:SpoVK/Ycf46/Vps4 family AAA+-type ATPase
MKPALTQYYMKDNRYIAIGETVPILPAGYYTISQDSTGSLNFVPTKLTTDSLLRLTDSKSDEVIAEIEHFWTLKNRFTQYGLVHKRGFLLYGPPGGGKTSTMFIVANNMIAKGGIVLDGSTHPVHLNIVLKQLRQIEPNRPLVIIMEDLEDIVRAQESLVLSVLDGQNSVDNVVFIATTNYPEKLEARVINRPSRFDKVVRIAMPSREARSQYIKHCDPSIGDMELAQWLDVSDQFSIAQLKELIIGIRCMDSDIVATAERIRTGNLIVNEKQEAKNRRNKSFFEKFYAIAEQQLPPIQMKHLRDTVVAELPTPEPTATPTAEQDLTNFLAKLVPIGQGSPKS